MNASSARDSTRRDRLAVSGVGRRRMLPPGLTPNEQAAFQICAEENVRVEQERLPQTFVHARLQSAFTL